MAQLKTTSSRFAAQDNRKDMRIPVFWASANLDPPWQFKIWFEQFLMAVTVKENVNPEIILEEPKDILEEPPPRPETPREGENEDARNARTLRDKLVRDTVLLENEERRTRGPRVGHNVFYNEVQKKLMSRLFLSLGTEGKKRFLQKNPHAEISKMTFREIKELAEVSFQKVKCVTYERYKLFTRMQESGESLESFHAALTAQAARSELGTLENEIVRSNLTGPSSPAEESDKKKTEKKAKEKKNQNNQNRTGQTATAADPKQEQSTSKSGKLGHKTQLSSTPKSKQRTKLKCIDSQTPPEDILDTFQNRNLAPSDWEKFADQLLKRGVQRVADDIRGDPQQISEKDTTFEPPQGFSEGSSAEESSVRRSSRQTKNKEPKRFGDPIKHSIKEISENLTGGALLKTAPQEYRKQLRDFKERSDRPVESKLKRLERHLFMRKFGYATLDEGVEWNPSWEIELEEN